MALRVLTLNLWKNRTEWAARAPRVRHSLSELGVDAHPRGPDLMGLQEVWDGAEHGMIGDIVDRASWHVAFGPSKPDRDATGLGYGNALVSRWPIATTEVCQLPDLGFRERRAVLLARVESPWGPLPVAVTHLAWRLDQGFVRCAQVVALHRAIEAFAAPGDLPALLLGDFNAAPESAEIRFLQGLAPLDGVSAHYRDAWRIAGHTDPGHTWSSRNLRARWSLEPNRRIDYVFTQPPDPAQSHFGHVLACAVVLDAPVDAIQLSDHFGVLATLSTSGLAFDDDGVPYESA